MIYSTVIRVCLFPNNIKEKTRMISRWKRRSELVMDRNPAGYQFSIRILLGNQTRPSTKVGYPAGYQIQYPDFAWHPEPDLAPRPDIRPI